MENDPVSDVTVEAVAAISAYWADQARVPWDGYPRNPHTGLVYTYWHTEFAAKRCPFDAITMERFELQEISSDGRLYKESYRDAQLAGVAGVAGGLR